MASPDAFNQVRSAFNQVDIPGRAELSFALHTVQLGEHTRARVTELIQGHEKKSLGRFAELLLENKL